MLNGLFDIGASGTHIKHRALTNVRYAYTRVNVQVNGRYAKTMVKGQVEFKISLPEFCESRTVTIKAYIDKQTVGNYDIVFGRRFCSKPGLIIEIQK